jgi:hypothetical protein
MHAAIRCFAVLAQEGGTAIRVARQPNRTVNAELNSHGANTKSFPLEAHATSRS